MKILSLVGLGLVFCIFILSLKFIYAWNPDTKLNIARLVYIKQLQCFVSEPL